MRLQRNDGAVLVHLRTTPPCSHGKGECSLMAVAVPASGFICELCEVAEIGHWPHLLRCVVSDQLHIDSDAAVHGDVGAQGANILRSHPDEVPGLPISGLGPEYFCCAFKNWQSVPGHGGQRPDAVMAANDATRLPGPPGSEGGPVQHQHVAQAQLNQRPGSAEPGDPGPHNDDFG